MTRCTTTTTPIPSPDISGRSASEPWNGSSTITTPEPSTRQPPSSSAAPVLQSQRRSDFGAINYRDRVLIIGPSESGKSILARKLYLSAAAPRTAIDPSDSEICDVPGSVTFRDPTRFDPSVPTSRFVPSDPGDMDAYDDLYHRIRIAGGPRYIWVDEAGWVLPAAGTTKWSRNVVVQGRKAELGHLALHIRIKEIYVNLKAVLAHLIIFGVVDKADRDYAAQTIGITPEQLAAALAQLEPFGFLWWQRVNKKILVCPPLPL